MNFKNTILVFLIISNIFGQKFDPVTGEIIDSDSLKIKINPETGEVFKPNINFSEKTDLLEDWQIINIAKRDAGQNFENEKTSYEVMGGATALFSIPPTTAFLSVLGAILGDEGGSTLGFFSGVLVGAVVVPEFLAKIDSKPMPIFLDQERIKKLNNNKKQLYLKEYSKELIGLRSKAIQRGEIKVAAGSFISFMAFIILVESAF